MTMNQAAGSDYPPIYPDRTTPSHAYPHPSGPGPGYGSFNINEGLLTQGELDQLKRELVSGLKDEVRAAAKQMMTTYLCSPHNGVVGGAGLGMAHTSVMPAPQAVPQLMSELYQTHLYTQL